MAVPTYGLNPLRDLAIVFSDRIQTFGESTLYNVVKSVLHDDTGLFLYDAANGAIRVSSDKLKPVPGPRGLPGAKGDTGEPGWAPVLSVVADGERRVLQLTDWAGGVTDKPATGSYVGATGYVVLIADAVDIRGSAGSGDMTGPAGAVDGHIALFDGATGKLLKLGGAPFSGVYADLSEKPTLFSGVYAELTEKPTLGTAAAMASTAFMAAGTGQPVPTSISDFRVGSLVLAYKEPRSLSLAPGASVAGSSLRLITMDGDGNVTATTSGALSGTWRSLQTVAGYGGYFVRIA